MLHHINIFGKQASFNFNGKEKYSSYFGVACSIIVYLLTFTLLGIMVIDMFNRSQIVVNYVKSQKTVSSNMTWRENENIFMISLVNSNGSALDTSIASVSLYYVTRNETYSTVIVLPLIYCKNDPYFNLLSVKYSIEIYSTLYCISSNDTTIGGKFGSNFYGFIEVIVNKCVNGTSNIECKDQNTIDTSLFGSWFDFYYMDKSIDVLNFKNPFSSFLTSVYVNMDKHLTKIMEVSFAKNTISSNNNLIFNTASDVSAFKYLVTTRDVISTSEEPAMVIFTLTASLVEETYFRTYMKFQDVAAKIGGIFKTLTIGCSIICTILNKLSMKRIISNKIFTHGDNMSKTVNDDDRPSTIIINNYLKNKPTESRMKIITLKEMAVGTFLPCIKSHYNQKIKVELVDKFLNKYVDFMAIANGMKDIYYLKTILLDNSQFDTFNYLRINISDHANDLLGNNNSVDIIDRRDIYKSGPHSLERIDTALAKIICNN